MRTLFLVNKPVYPPSGGSALRNWQNITAASTLGDVATFAVQGDAPSGIRRDEVAVERTHVAGRMSAPRRLRALLRRDGFPESERAYRSDIDADLRQLLREFSPDVAVFAEPWMYRYLPTVLAHGCAVVHDTHNVESVLREAMARTRPTAWQRWRWGWSASQLARVERALCTASDRIWACSAEDAALLHQRYAPRAEIDVIANGVDLSYYASVRERAVSPPPGLQGAPCVAFVAAYSYPPNAAAAMRLATTIFPLVRREIGNAKLLLVGRDPGPELRRLAGEDVVVTGRVDDVRPWLAAASVVATPLDVGGGTRLKIVEAFASLRPVVSTAKGVEGLPVVPGEHYVRAESPSETADAIVSLIRSPERGERLTRAAHALAEQSLGQDAIRERVAASLREAHEHRRVR